MRSSVPPTSDHRRSSRLPTVRPTTPRVSRSSMGYPQTLPPNSSPPPPPSLAAPQPAANGITPTTTPSKQLQETQTHSVAVSSATVCQPPLQQQFTPLNPPELPFFKSNKQAPEFIANLETLAAHLSNLQKANNHLTNFNESISSLLFGLNINAWCIHFDKSPTIKTWSNLEKLVDVNKKISNLRQKIDALEHEKQSRLMMPPPPPLSKQSTTNNTNTRRGTTTNTNTKKGFWSRLSQGNRGIHVKKSLSSNINKKTIKTPQLKTTTRTRTPTTTSNRRHSNIPIRKSESSESSSTVDIGSNINTSSTTLPSSRNSSTGTSTSTANRRYSRIPIGNRHPNRIKNDRNGDGSWKVKGRTPFR